MKFQLKTLVAAVALIGATGSAFAAVPNVDAATGSALLFYVFDDVTKSSYVQDLGKTYASFLPASAIADQTFGISSHTASWNAYLTSVSGNLGNSTWGVFAGNSVAANNGGKGFLTTMRDGDSSAAQTSSSAQSSVAGFFKTWIAAMNVQNTNAGTSLSDGYFTDIQGTNSQNIVNGVAHDGGAKLKFKTDNFVGTDSVFHHLALGTKVTDNSYANVNGVSKFSFDGNNLKYTVAVAAIPEPSSYAMMLAGLMLVAGVARRRHLNK
jgi:hypothetical protein